MTGQTHKSYTFEVVLEEDSYPDGTLGYSARVPALEHLGAATHGRTAEDTLKSMQEILTMILENLAEEGKQIPTDAAMVSEQPVVTVTL